MPDLESGCSESCACAMARATGQSGCGGASASSASEDSITWRDLQEVDLAPLQALQILLFPVRYSDSFYRKLLWPGYCTRVGIASSGELVAVASARVVDDHQQELPGSAAYLMTLGVDEAYRRRGLGTKAIREVIVMLRERTAAEVVILHVKTENAGAFAFYQRLGFVIDEATGFSENHYLIDGKNYHAYELSYAIPSERRAAQPHTQRPCTPHRHSRTRFQHWQASVVAVVGVHAALNGLPPFNNNKTRPGRRFRRYA